MWIERWDYGVLENGLGQRLLDELVVFGDGILHVERLDRDKVFVGFTDKDGNQIQIYFEVEKDGVLDWRFKLNEPEPTLVVPPRKEGSGDEPEGVG